MNNKVSIITPSYNTAKFIEETINSVLSQTYTDWELIIVDDCSEDNTVQEAKKYESKITVGKDGKTAEARKLMALMGLSVKCGDEVEVTVEGADEEKALEEMKLFFETNL